MADPYSAYVPAHPNERCACEKCKKYRARRAREKRSLRMKE